MVSMKYNCCKCQEMAIWFYLHSDYNKVSNERYYCDICIKRGCQCNINPENGFEDLDEQHRPYPCSEYIYDDRGFDMQE